MICIIAATKQPDVCGLFLSILYLKLGYSCNIQRTLDGRVYFLASQTYAHLQVKEHDGYDRPLGGFVDDVLVGEPVVDRKGK